MQRCPFLAVLWLFASMAASVPVAPEARPDPATVGRLLLAHWPFDEDGGTVAADIGGNGRSIQIELGAGAAGRRVPGVFGAALRLSGRHRLWVAGGLGMEALQRITLSAWVQPTAFDRYNEIFRKEDGEKRVLFSFQENGTILSLGLNVDGYVECDAPIDPEQVLDGRWHHCAATFDGCWMRVYLDGREIRALEREGRLAAGGGAPGCLGSMNGSECFQGALDDARLYGEALTAAEVGGLFASGQPALERFERELEERLAGLLDPGPTFAETIARTRARLAGLSEGPDAQTVGALVRRVKGLHPREFDEFSRLRGPSVADLFETRDAGIVAREGARVRELLVEYRPLTKEQWGRQTPEALRAWKDIEAIERELAALEAQGDAAACSPAWIEVLIAAGRRIQFRPQAQEAVAPYVRPRTPAARTLTEAEARAALERDWLHQAGGAPAPERIREEIAWTRQLAQRFAAGDECAEGSDLDDPSDRPNPADRSIPWGRFVKSCLNALSELERRAMALRAPDRGLYFEVRELKRGLMFRNPAVDFDRVLFVDMPFPEGSEWQHETRHRLGYMAVPGGRLLVLEGLGPGGRLRQLMPQAPLHGSFWRPDLSWDGSRVLFCYKPHNEKSFHLYEIGIDGLGLRQLTDGPYDDLDPIYLPDERRVIFATTRGHTYVRCMPPTSAFVLARCDLDGGNMYLISANNEPDYLPSVLADGRLVYTRWEYTDKPLWRAQKLWTVHPDGTQASTLWGNQSVWPDLVKDARGIPGSARVMVTGSAHHNWFAGSVGIIDPNAGLNFPDGLTKVTADAPWPECGNGPVDPVESPQYHSSGEYAAYYSPYPLSERDFLVSANRAGKFVLYLMDVDGNRELIYEGAHHVLHALPLRPRLRAPVLEDAVVWPLAGREDSPQPGVFYSRDVYAGAPEVLRGRARFLRVLSIDHKTYTYWHKRPYLSTGPVVSGVQSDGVKRLLGTVPIEDDGSVLFEAPAGIPLHFQLLDADQCALHTMRSFANLMPGERRGCLGCHERHSRAPSVSAAYRRPASLPRTITPPPWSDTTVSYARYVRPILDRYCVECHSGEGAGRQTLDLTARPGFLGFDEAYWVLTGRPSWGAPYSAPEPRPPGWGIADMLMVEAFGTTDPAGYRTPAPMSGLSSRSRLIELVSHGGHHDTVIDPLSRLRLIVWVDAICPYLGDEEIRDIPDPEFQGIDWLAVRPRIRTAPRIARPGPVNESAAAVAPGF